MRTGFLFAVLLSGLSATAQPYLVQSPDGNIRVTVTAGAQMAYSIERAGQQLLNPSAIGLQIDSADIGKGAQVLRQKTRQVRDKVAVPVPVKADTLADAYNELRLELKGNAAVVFRVYDNGVAYRWETALKKESVRINSELVSFDLEGAAMAYFPRESGFFSHQEPIFEYLSFENVASQTLASLPVVWKTKSGTNLFIAESDVEEYPGLWIRGTGGPRLLGAHPPYPLKTQLQGDRDLRVTEAAPYIAQTKGTRTFPWRIIGIAENDASLLTNSLVYLLAKPNTLTDISWIRPGKVAWDWWNANNIYGVPFESGINTATYKHYIDFAAKNGIEYIILDEGYYVLGDVLKFNPDINMEELTAYARDKKRPILLARTYPNLITTEGIRGLEWSKWSDNANPEHNLTIPFTRMLLGPMDYTPGAMINVKKENFRAVFDQPMSLGTRCHQLGMYVVFESPLQMLADNPSNYEREPECMKFLREVPVTWDETRVLEAEIGDYVVIARRKGPQWYLGAMTDWTAREITIQLSFLSEGSFQLESWSDGPNAHKHGSDFSHKIQEVNRSTAITLKLAPGGGYAGVIRR
ncbi:MAG: glycoside hydrolase family 97 protein [Haliscomenobacter sp.]|nr:glycoside hydrolase family 97 protein [Haliscomenobacter sp.]